MIVVYTNSKERAMLLATRLDGVVLSNNIKVRPQNYLEHHDQLERELTAEGYMTAFFCGQQYLFVYSNGTISVPFRMADYNAVYEDCKERPTPFIPDELDRKIVDPDFEKRLPLYRQIVQDAGGIVNAAEDNLRGELAFSQFCDLCEVDDVLHIWRVRPRSMTEACVFETFNSPEDGSISKDYQVACRLWERFSWLLSCNIYNSLGKYSLNNVNFPTGYLEALILSYLYHEKKSKVREKVQVELSDGSYCTVQQFDGNSTFPAQQVIQLLNSSNSNKAELVNHIDTVTRAQLYNIFTLQFDAEERFGFEPAKIVEMAYSLYNHSYITWPTESSSMPWDMKVEFTSASVAINANPTFTNKFKPRELDRFSDWDMFNNPYKHMGILITGKVLGPDMTPDERKIYDLICENNIAAVTEKRREIINTYKMSVGEHELLLMSRAIKTVHWTEEMNHSGDMADAAVNMVSATVKTKPSDFSKRSVLIDIYTAMKDGFWPDPLAFSTAMNNVIAWGQVTVTSEQRIDLARRSWQGLKYLLFTQACDFSCAVNWVKRLSFIAQATGDADSFVQDTSAYVRDICDEISNSADELKECGGICLKTCECPVCKNTGEVAEDGSWHCSSCTFTIPASIFGHPLGKADIAYLLTHKRSRLMDGFVSAKGKEYSARIIISQGKLERSFVAPFPCPKCHGSLNEYAWGLKCQNAECGFTLNTTVCGHKLTDMETAQIFSGKQTKFMHLTNSKGKSFVAALALKDDFTVQFVFPAKNKEN